MNRLLLGLIISASLAGSASAAGPDTSYAQLLKQISPQAEAVPLPAPETVAAVPEQDDRFWVTLTAADKYERTRLLEAGFDIVEIDGNKVSGFAHARTLQAIRSQKSAGTAVRSALPIKAYMEKMARDFPAADAAYHNYQETSDLLKALAAKHPDVASVFSIGKTVENRDIWALRINKGAKGSAASGKPGAFFLGNMHAREHLANEVPLLFAAYLLENRNDAEIRKYIDTLDIYVVPMNNPDGVEYDIASGSYKNYRKNRRKNMDGSYGVDLNRNYDSWFCQQGASNSAWSDTYCGPKAFSEPESQAIKKFFEARPNIKTHISYHSFGGQVLYPWGGSEDDIPSQRDLKAFRAIALQLAGITGYRAEKSSDMYVATGDSCDWAYQATGALAFTFELEGRGFYPGAAIIKSTVERNIKAAVYLLSVTGNPYAVN